MLHFHEHIKRVLALRKRAKIDKELEKKEALVLQGKVWRFKDKQEKEKIQKTLDIITKV